MTQNGRSLGAEDTSDKLRTYRVKMVVGDCGGGDGAQHKGRDKDRDLFTS